jgi:hypothetical protein
MRSFDSKPTIAQPQRRALRLQNPGQQALGVDGRSMIAPSPQGLHALV